MHVCVRVCVACRWRKKTTTAKVKAHAVGGLKFEWGISSGVGDKARWKGAGCWAEVKLS